MFELLLQLSDQTSHVVAFATAWAKVTFTSLLKGIGGKESEGGWGVPEAIKENLRAIGWLRESRGKPTDEILEMPLSPSLNPLGFTPSAVVFQKDGELRKVSMPTILQAILGYLSFLNNSEDTMLKALEQIQNYSPQEAGKEFLYGSWAGAEIIQAVEQAYRYVLQTDSEVLEELLGTGNEVILYQTEQDHENPTLGVAKEGRSWKGKNFVGHVLMALRHEYGGEPDPRLDLIRGYREYTVEEVTPGGEGFQKHRETVAYLQAEIIYGDKPSSKDEEEVKEYLQGVEALKNFILETEWWPLPLFDEAVLIEDTQNPASLACPEPFLKWLCLLAKKGVMNFIGAETSGLDEVVIPVSKMDLGESIDVRPYDPVAHSLKVHIHTSRGAEWWTWYLSEQTAKLTPSQCVKVFSILAKNRMAAVDWHTSTEEVHFSSGQELYTWNFKTRLVDARQPRKAFKRAIIHDKPVDSKFILLWLALRALDGFQGLNGTLNSLANFWEREANYGHAWEEDHPTRIVRDNSWAPLGVRGDFLDPFGMTVLNGQFSYELFLKLISTPACRHDAYVDKNGMKVLAGNGAGAASLTSIKYPDIALQAFEALDAGVNPMLVLAMVLDKDEMFTTIVEILSGTKPTLIVMKKFGIFMTLNDGAKMPKFLNRAQQGASWNEALCEVTFEGKTYKRAPSLMTVVKDSNPEWKEATPEDEADFLSELLST